MSEDSSWIWCESGYQLARSWLLHCVNVVATLALPSFLWQLVRDIFGKCRDLFRQWIDYGIIWLDLSINFL